MIRKLVVGCFTCSDCSIDQWRFRPLRCFSSSFLLSPSRLLFSRVFVEKFLTNSDSLLFFLVNFSSQTAGLRMETFGFSPRPLSVAATSPLPVCCHSLVLPLYLPSFSFSLRGFRKLCLWDEDGWNFFGAVFPRHKSLFMGGMLELSFRPWRAGNYRSSAEKIQTVSPWFHSFLLEPVTSWSSGWFPTVPGLC